MMKAPRDELLDALRDVIPAEPGIAVIHSSFSRLLPPAGFKSLDALYAITRLVDSGWTIALPAFTFSFCGGKAFDARRSPSETGVLADWLLAHAPQAQRTRHPIYSFAVIGPRAAEIVQCRSSTTFGDDSPFGLFERSDATLVMLGCGLESCTQFHRCEEVAAVPYRYFKTFSGDADYGGGPTRTEAAMYVRDLPSDPINDFSRAIEALRAGGALVVGKLWRGDVTAVRAANLATTCAALIAENPFALISNGPHVARHLEVARQAASQPAFRIAILGNSNVHMLQEALSVDLSALMPERRTELHAPPFGQLERALIDPGSELHRFQPQLQIFCDRVEDILGLQWMEAGDSGASIRRYAGLIQQHVRAHGGWTVVHSFAVLAPSANADIGKACSALIAGFNQLLVEMLADLPQLIWLDLAAEAAACPGEIVDKRLWHLGRFPFSSAFSRHVARRWSGLALSILGKTARVVVVDLDNTLWGGVLGEDGVTGIAVGGDYPGNAYAEFQRALKELTRSGLALAVCSKNDEDLALKAIDGLPSMVLRSSDFSARRINWHSKSANIREIAAELNLGLESVLLVDDNPVEREAVRRNLPMVKVVDLPADPALYAQALALSPYLAAATITREDQRRLQSFAARKLVAAARDEAASLDDFYASLKMTLHCQPLDAGNGQRAEQLCQKTNQFNTTTRRYDLRELQALSASGADVVVLGLEDRLSELENIGLLILKPDDDVGGEVDSFLLSCRVLGRGLETAALHWALHRAAQRNWPHLRGAIITTERNLPVRSVYSDAGFAQSATNGEWHAQTAQLPTLPAWLTIVDRMQQISPDMPKAVRAAAPASASAPVGNAPRPDAPAAPSATAAVTAAVTPATTATSAGAPATDQSVGTLIAQLLQLPDNHDLSDGGLGVTPGWDSLRQIDIVLGLEEALAIRFSSEELSGLTRFSDLEDTCRRKLAQRR
jgi:FkbH-like protein